MSENLRRVKVESIPFYQSDSGAGEYKFTVNRYFGKVDLSTLTVFLKIRFSDESSDKILLSDKTVENEQIIITCHLSDAVSRVAGKAHCQITFENTLGTVIINTQVFTITILDSVEVESYGQTILPSAIRLLQTELGQKIETTNQKINEVSNMVTVEEVALSLNGWTNQSQSVSVDSAKEDSVIMVAPLTNPNVFATSTIFVSGQGEGYVTFGYLTKPTASLGVKVVVINKVEA